MVQIKIYIHDIDVFLFINRIGTTDDFFRVSFMPNQENLSPIYLANQVSACGLDELQQLFLCWTYRFPVALDGPPGVGKTQSIIEISRILNKEMFSKSCSDRSTESHLISHPVLVEQGGATVTEHRNGPLARAMEKGGIFYGDEFNLLKSDLQKRLNCAFDSRREIDRNDGYLVTAHVDFWGTISYNPKELRHHQDLDDSVADRFIHLNYRRWSSNFKAYVASSSAATKLKQLRPSPADFGVRLQVRGIDIEQGRFICRQGKSWFDFFSGEPYHGHPSAIYAVHDELSSLKGGGVTSSSLKSQKVMTPAEFSSALSQFTSEVCELARTGKTSHVLGKKMGKEFDSEIWQGLLCHETSTRIESMAQTLYLHLLGMKCPEPMARSFAVEVVIGQLCYGQYRKQDLDGSSAHELIENIAKFSGLLDHSKSFNTSKGNVRQRA